MPKRSRSGALADHDVDLVVLERGIKYLLDDRREPVDLVDEQHVIGLEVGEDGGQVARPLEHRPGRMAQVHGHLVGDDVRERGLAEPGRPEQQHVIQRFAPLARRLDEDGELPADLLLADVLLEQLGTQRPLEGFLLGSGGRRGDEAVGLYHGMREA